MDELKAEQMVLAAVGMEGGRSWEQVREHVPVLTDREFAAAARRLVSRGAIVRQGRGADARVRRDLRAWTR